MKASETRPIVIKRTKRAAAGHHGGAWKIAYADFVTAMMAFFLLMWLLGSTTQGDLEGIADYFRTPLKVALAGGSGSGDSSSVIRSGGQDLSRTHGQIARTDRPDNKRTINLQAAQAELKRELTKMRELRQRLQQAIDLNPTAAALAGQVRMEVTDEGLRIQMVDALNRPMFDTGSARLKDYARELLREIARALGGVENRISVSGHTDAQPYPGDRSYTNWELSADRSNAARRELLGAGLPERRIVRVVGLADSQHLNGADALDPANRRISIVVMTKKAESEALKP